MEPILEMPSHQSLKNMSDSQITAGLQSAIKQLLRHVHQYESTAETRLIYEAYKTEQRERFQAAAQKYKQASQKHIQMVHDYNQAVEKLIIHEIDHQKSAIPVLLNHLNCLLKNYEILTEVMVKQYKT